MKATKAGAPRDAAPGRNGHALIKIGDFAKLAGTNLRTLRYYEEIGLLHPALRSAGGFRYYRAEDLERLAMVASLQHLGLELARIGELMDTRADGRPRVEFQARVRRALQEQAALIDSRMRELDVRRKGLDQALAKLAECADCSHRPAGLNNYCNPCQIDRQALPADLSALF
ncbi:MAG: MerR family transcriptional regulator [Planctomycetes bacterium]|nr:MerR family transcriptional regulator [Planctomycetota bacterium]